MSEAVLAGSSPPTKPPLDDVMLAMDVVDTLRRRERLVTHELDDTSREEDLKVRLHRIYTAQGIEVSDAIIEAGVKALKEDRFVYQPPASSLAVSLARFYVRRGEWGKWVIGALAALAIGIGAWQMLVVGPRDALPGQVRTVATEVAALARDDDARARVEALRTAADAALAAGDSKRVKAVLGELEQTRRLLRTSYTLRVVNRPNERSGVWRIPDVNDRARNYYLIVEAIDPSGQLIKVPVTNEETRKSEQVTRFGVRVDERTFNRVANDKKDDGIIQQDILGRKGPGTLTPTWTVSTSGATITSW